ncbi:uncharacterized protein LOC128226025 [Mya arenaria]|uniref:uncharacterized protein LOC128226025 n=1 Tax=Mya arenaria TaxID=6604 RepID=UPI0022E711EC|nr:uncharacterized protein LOC128226025 [Mya arenaria]
MCAITETWLGSSIDRECSSELVPTGYAMKHVPRSGRRGGGVALVYKTPIKVRIESSTKDNIYSQFEHMDCNVMIGSHSLCFAVIYRPPVSKTNGLQSNIFLEQEWPKFLARYATSEKPTIIVGDVNFHLDVKDNTNTTKFVSSLNACGMKQHVEKPTHTAGHTLDVLITRDNERYVSSIEVIDPCLSDSNGRVLNDHYAVMFYASASRPPPIRKTVTYRKLRSINIDNLREDIRNTDFFGNKIIPLDIDTAVEEYSNILNAIIDKHAPLKTKTIVLRPSCPWYTESLHDAKHQKRKLERKWRDSKLAVDHQIYRQHCSEVNKLLKQSRIDYYTSQITQCGNDYKKLFKVTNTLLGKSNEVTLPSHSSPEQMAQDFSDFFVNKIEKIRDSITSHRQSVSSSDYPEDVHSGTKCEVFSSVTEEEVKSIIQKSSNKSCELDPIPTWLLKDCLGELAPMMTMIINASLDSAYVPKAFKQSNQTSPQEADFRCK